MPTHTAEAQTSQIDDEHQDDTRQDERHQQQHQEPRDGHAQTQVQLTPTLRAGTEALQLNSADIFAKIAELTEVGLDFIDRLKEEFESRMKEAREQIEQYAHDQSQEWAAQGEAMAGLQQRLFAVQGLVGQLQGGFAAS